MALIFYVLLDTEIWESFAFSFIFTFGIVGFVGFLLNEYLNIAYSLIPKYIFLPILAFSLLIFNKSNRIRFFKKINDVKIKSLVIGLVFAAGLFIWGTNTPVRGWDAYSMYDARAKMFNLGEKMSGMGALTRYDDKNNLYYFSYPPMTSAVHALVYSVGFRSPMFLYIFLLVSLFVIFYEQIRKLKISMLYKVAIFAAALLNPLIFDQITIAYSNLPAVAFQIAAIVMIIKFIVNRRFIYVITAGIFLGFSNWTRSLEPTFIAILLAFIFILIKSYKTSILTKLTLFGSLLLLAIVPRQLWFAFVVKHVGVTGATMPNAGQLALGLLDSVFLSNLISVAFFIYSSLITVKLYILIFVIIFIVMLLSRQVVENLKFQFLGIVIVSIFAIMTVGTLYFSQVFVWWNQISGSFLRSNLILVPLIGLYSGYFLEYFENKPHNGRIKK